jgi:hypothetical protein
MCDALRDVLVREALRWRARTDTTRDLRDRTMRRTPPAQAPRVTPRETSRRLVAFDMPRDAADDDTSDSSTTISTPRRTMSMPQTSRDLARLSPRRGGGLLGALNVMIDADDDDADSFGALESVASSTSSASASSAHRSAPPEHALWHEPSATGALATSSSVLLPCARAQVTLVRACVCVGDVRVRSCASPTVR